MARALHNTFGRRSTCSLFAPRVAAYSSRRVRKVRERSGESGDLENESMRAWKLYRRGFEIHAKTRPDSRENRDVFLHHQTLP